MRRWLALPLVALVVLAVSTTATIGPRAQSTPSAGPRRSVQDALRQPFDFPFAAETPLRDVAAYLGRALGASVVLDRAGMARLDVLPDDTVQLELKGARLETGLRLLLDQLDMTYRVEPEDNLLVLTDPTGAADPFERVLSELESLHHDVHDLRDSVDDLRSAMGLDAEGQERLRKPTIIEEMPPADGPDTPAVPPARKPTSPARPGAALRKPA